jgi:hypothetical protein
MLGRLFPVIRCLASAPSVGFFFSTPRFFRRSALHPARSSYSMAALDIPDSFQAIRVAEFGPESVLQLQTVPRLSPGEKEILIKVLAVGINPVDTYIRAGTYARKPALPYTPGADAAGVVIALGANCSEEAPQPGQRVWVSGSRSGTYAQYCVSAENQVHLLPQRLTFAQGMFPFSLFFFFFFFSWIGTIGCCAALLTQFSIGNGTTFNEGAVGLF